LIEAHAEQLLGCLVVEEQRSGLVDQERRRR
jgi:hypothetical protein